MDGCGDVTQLLEAISSGDGGASEELLPVVYEELRRLARAQFAHESKEQTLQPTALVHEAYLRLVHDEDARWNGRGHFFGAAARAMRRILIERARQRRQLKRGGEFGRVELSPDVAICDPDSDALLALDEVIDRLEARDSRKSEVVVLRYFGGLTIDETATALGVSPATVKNDWAYARAWLSRELSKGDTRCAEGDDEGS